MSQPLLKPYAHYKDSGIDWLGEVPAHWEAAPLKRGYDVRLGKMLQPESSGIGDELFPYLRAANIHWSGINFEDLKSMWFSLKEREQLTLLKGDLLISEGGDVGRSSIWQSKIENCYFQNSINRVRAKSDNSTYYLYYWILALKDKGYVDIVCNKSTIAHFTAEKVQIVPVLYPPPFEQTAIAEFLDRETRKIDELVAEQRRLIDLLKEKRQAVISHAVTKGLNPNAPMKDSGIEWLGEIPAHWDSVALKRYCLILDCKHLTAEFIEEGIPLASIREVQSRFVNLENAKQTTTYFYEQLIDGERKPLPGDLIFSRNATVGEVAQVSEQHPPFAMGQDVCLLRKHSSNTSTDYLQLVLRSKIVIDQLANLMIGSTFKRINVEEIRNLIIPFPPSQEQATIAEFLLAETKKFDELTIQAERAIELLQERRTALISAAVTGKIDVRQPVQELIPA